MQVETANAPASLVDGDTTHYFCSDHCRGRLEADPARFSVRTGAASPERPTPPDHSGGPKA